MVRGTLVNAIYAQTLDLSITSLDESAAVTLMSSDVQRICEALTPIHTLWSSPIEIALAIWFLQNEIGLALFGPLLITALAVCGPFIISKRMGKAQKTWIEKIQTRIDTTAKMLHTMKGVKMLGIGSRMASIVSRLRLEEMAESLKQRKLFVIMIAFGNLADILAPGAAFVIFVIVATVNGQTLDVTSAFTALSIIRLLVAPIRSFVFSAPPLIAAFSCFDRIQAFISSPTTRDYRMLLPLMQDETRLDSRSANAAGSTGSNSDIEMEDLTLLVNAGLRPATIQVKNLSLAWGEEDSPVVNDVSFDIQPGKLTMIVGPVGCGKSSLLRGLLGETPSSKGHVYIDQAHAAFVGQIPWIQNSSIRSNIVGVSVFEPEWYARVVNACAFYTDIEAFSAGDSTSVGSAGASLSGGQRLRVVSSFVADCGISADI